MLARLLHDTAHVVCISSLAGRVSEPKLPVGDYRIGGFGGRIGLTEYLVRERIDAVVDATHPFAVKMTQTAATVCDDLGLPRLLLQRPPYRMSEGDRWIRVDSMEDAAYLVPELGRRVFITTGRNRLRDYAQMPQDVWCLVRCVDPPVGPVPPNLEVLLARGPFDAASERELLLDNRIDVMTSKDSGGELTEGKLIAARELDIPVIMVSRPEPVPSELVTTPHEAMAWVEKLVAQAADHQVP